MNMSQLSSPKGSSVLTHNEGDEKIFFYFQQVFVPFYAAS